jgi:hypothetical protein
MQQIRRIPITSLIISALSAVFWGIGIASIWMPMNQRALPVDRDAAVASVVIASISWTARWLRGRDMAYLVDAVITQHARAVSQTRPLPVWRKAQ